MIPQVMRPIDKSPAPMDHRGILSRASGRSHRRIARGDWQCMGWSMVRVINQSDTFRLEWCCRLCGGKCTLNQLWLAIPRGEQVEAQVEAQWAHRPCIDALGGRVKSTFGTHRITLMRGIDAIRRLAESLEDATDDPALARQQPRRLAKA
jgi:hypothetical protein